MKNAVNLCLLVILIFMISIFSTNAQDTSETPRLIIPWNDYNDISAYTTFCWFKVEGAEVYRLQYSKNQDMSDYIVIETTDTSYYCVIPIDTNTNYFWKVQAGKYKQGNEIEWFSNWSNIWKFQTDDVLLIPPYFYYLANHDNELNILNWLRVPGAKLYRIQIANDNGLFQKIIIDTLTSDTCLLNIKFEYRKRYYYRACSINDDFTSNWSAIKYFSTEEQFKYGKIYELLLSPPNYSTKQLINGYLTWKKYREVGYNFNYQLQFFEPNNDSLKIIIDTIFSDTAYYYHDLNYYTNYTWKLRVMSEVDTSIWLTHTFRTEFENPPDLPEKVELLEPIDRETINVYIIFPVTDVYNLILKWKPSSPYIDMYWVEISTSPDFTDSYVEDRYNSTEYDATWNFQNDGVMNYWRVRAYNDTGWGPFSDVWSFFPIYHFIGVDDNQSPDNNISIYPNPVTDFAYIKIKSKEQGKGIIKIFNILGVEVDIIEYENNESGETTINWKTQNLPSGTYFIKARIGNRDIVKPIQKFK